jgi:DNA replication protein DnaC
MKTINSLITESKVEEQKVKRFQYMPYSEKIAKNVWFGIAKKLIGKIEITDNIKSIWSNLIKYVHGDESCAYDITKSLLIMGRTGSGKSKTMEILSEYIKIDNVKFSRNGKIIPFDYNIFSARDIVADYASSGYDGIAKYTIYSNICIDDLGTEGKEMANYFGTKLDVIPEVIELRYSKGLTTHFTSNLNLELIKDRYDDRVFSRISQQCNEIVMNDKDFRLT